VDNSITGLILCSLSPTCLSQEIQALENEEEEPPEDLHGLRSDLDDFEADFTREKAKEEDMEKRLEDASSECAKAQKTYQQYQTALAEMGSAVEPLKVCPYFYSLSNHGGH